MTMIEDCLENAWWKIADVVLFQDGNFFSVEHAINVLAIFVEVGIFPDKTGISIISLSNGLFTKVKENK